MEELRPDIVILDIGMPKLSGIEVAARAQKLERPPGVIVLSMHADESYILRALAAGTRAYLLKDATDEDLLPAIRAVASGKPYLDRKSTRLNSSHLGISYAVFCLKKKKKIKHNQYT